MAEVTGTAGGFSGASVNVDTIGLRALGDKIAAAVSGYNEEKTKINTLVDNISSAWSDPANKVFKTKVDSYKDSFDKLGVVMGEFGTFCIKKAAKFENTISNLEDTASTWL